MQSTLTSADARVLCHTPSLIQPPAQPTAQPAAAQAGMAHDMGTRPNGRGFDALIAAYRPTGGTARSDDIARVLQDRGLGNYIGLARLIAASDIFGFDWSATLWIPVFQLDVRDLTVKPVVRQVLAELGPAFDGWKRATWFVQPNSGLHGQRPVDMLDIEWRAVVAAAQADRRVSGS